ncbi:MAG: hypothetical protein AAFX55_02410 [Bacteroidota bacterium]
MKPTQLIFAVLFVILIVTSGCQKDDGHSGTEDTQEIIPNTFADYFDSEISRDFIGTVIDKNHNPIEGVTIRIGDETASTDSNGVFIIKDAEVNERFGYIKAEKAGYIHGSRSVVPTVGPNKVQLMLLEANPITTINSGTSTTVSITDGSSVSFDGNFINEDGTEYSGPVEVIMHHLDPTDEAMDLQMPGMLYAQNEDGAERMLQTLGMLAVELRGSGGEDLNLAEGSTSEIKIPVDSSLLSTAPATIPLWYFDEATGYWKEEGEATLQGNMYVGTVSHFSLWNCDIPAEAITLCVTVTSEEGNELNNLEVTISSTTFGTTNGYTNENGEVCGYVPSSEVLELQIFVPFCNSLALVDETVGSFTIDSEIIITVPSTFSITAETVSGTFNTCDGDIVTDGYVQLSYENQIFIDNVSNGNFEFDFLRCSNNDSFSIIGSDFVNSQSTGLINYTFTTPSTNIATLTVCNDISEFIEYSIDSGDSILITEDISVVFNGPNFNLQTTDCFSVIGYLPNPYDLGIYDTYYITGELPINTGFVIISNSGECSPALTNASQDVVYTLNSWGEPGGYIDINFNGTIRDLDFNFYNISGVIHVIRDE